MIKTINSKLGKLVFRKLDVVYQNTERKRSEKTILHVLEWSFRENVLKYKTLDGTRGELRTYGIYRVLETKQIAYDRAAMDAGRDRVASDNPAEICPECHRPAGVTHGPSSSPGLVYYRCENCKNLFAVQTHKSGDAVILNSK